MSIYNQIANMLIDAGANLNIISENGSSALSEAVSKDNYDLVEILVKKNANLMNREL